MQDITWEQVPDIGKIATLCELFFKSGVKDMINERFRAVSWSGAVQRILRRGAKKRMRRSTRGYLCTQKRARLGIPVRTEVDSERGMIPAGENLGMVQQDKFKH